MLELAARWAFRSCHGGRRAAPRGPLRRRRGGPRVGARGRQAAVSASAQGTWAQRAPGSAATDLRCAANRGAVRPPRPAVHVDAIETRASGRAVVFEGAFANRVRKLPGAANYRVQAGATAGARTRRGPRAVVAAADALLVGACFNLASELLYARFEAWWQRVFCSWRRAAVELRSRFSARREAPERLRRQCSARPLAHARVDGSHVSQEV